MARLLSDAGPSQSLAVRVLLFAAKELPIEELRVLATGLNQELALATLADPSADSRVRRAIESVRRAVEVTGHVPSTTEYIAAYREAAGSEASLVSISAILKLFGTWPLALAAAGTAAPPSLRGVARRRAVARRRVGRYSDERMLACVVACGREIGRTPSIRDYDAWREEQLGGASGRRAAGVDIPHFRSVEDRFGGWNKTLEAAGFDPDLAARAHERRYSAI